MVDADTFATKKIYKILISLFGRSLKPAKVNGSDMYPGMGVTWESASGTERDIDPSEDDDGDFAGVVHPNGDEDLDTLLTDDSDVAVCPPLTTAYALYVASGGALIAGDELYIDGTSDGYFTVTLPTQGAGVVLFPRGSFEYTTEKDQYHADVAAVTIQAIMVLFGGQQTIALV